MKIFNWVHKKFHHNVVKDGSAQSIKNTEVAMNYNETQMLLEQDFFDGWKDGILTIGTFGFDPSSYLDQQKEEEEYTENEEDDEDEDDEELEDHSMENSDEENESELNPLVFTTFRQDFKGYIDTIVPKSDHLTSPILGFPEMLEKVDNDQEKIKRERITLADLFLADSDVKIKLDSSKTLTHHSSKKPSLRAKNGLSFAKKLIPQVGEDSRPIKKLHQLMKRMLKRKIHPELASKVNKMDVQIKSCALELLTTNNKVDGIESVSLLQIQDAIV